MVRVKDGVVEEIVADKSDPVSEGAVCLKGLASIQLLQHLARLKSPLIRAGERGQGKWREAPWDEALNGYRTSWMARGSIFSIGLVGTSVLLMVALVRGEAALVPVTAASSLVLSGLVASYPGFLMFSILDIKLWRSPLLPILMFSYSVMSGLSLLQLEDLILGVKAGLALSYALLVGTVVLVILSLVFWGNSMHWSQGSREGYVLLTRGRLRVPFVVGVVAVGLASPFLCYACLILSGSSGTLFALAGTFVSGWCVLFQVLRRQGGFPRAAELLLK